LRIAASVTQPIDSVSQLRVDAGSRWSNNRVNDLQDGRGLSLKARYERALSPGLLVAASLGADRFKARDDAYSTRSWNAGLAAYQEFGRMTLSASIEIGGLKADERLSLLPKAREDELLRVSVGSVFRQFTVAGFAPVTRLVFERNKSTVEFYDYKRTRTEFGISRAF
jgi:outer membrane protein